METVTSVAGLPALPRERQKPKTRTLADFTEDERLEYERQLNARPRRVPRAPLLCSSPNDWRVLRAQFGSCQECGKRFSREEIIVWNVRTKEVLHPICGPDRYPSLAGGTRTGPQPAGAPSGNSGEPTP